jgi:hypothetical protein
MVHLRENQDIWMLKNNQTIFTYCARHRNMYFILSHLSFLRQSGMCKDRSEVAHS